jgi:chromosome partitioning protein
MGEKKRAAHVIAVGNQKGGVGKTTNTVHIAAALGQGGRKCLIIDLDAHAGATKHLGLPVGSYAGTVELLTTDESITALVVEKNMPPGVHLIPSRIHLADLDLLLSKFVDKTTILDRALAEARPLYDYVLLDTGPGAGDTTTVAAYASAEWFLLSAFAQPLSIEGLTDAFNDIAEVRKRRNPRLEVVGVVFSNIDRRAKVLRRQLVSTVDQALPGRKFATSISQAIMLPDVSGRGVTVFQVPKFRDSPTANEYLRLAAELDNRVNNRVAFLTGTLAPPDMLTWDESEGGEAEPAVPALQMNTGGDDGQATP